MFNCASSFRFRDAETGSLPHLSMVEPYLPVPSIKYGPAPLYNAYCIYWIFGTHAPVSPYSSAHPSAFRAGLYCILRRTKSPPRQASQLRRARRNQAVPLLLLKKVSIQCPAHGFRGTGKLTYLLSFYRWLRRGKDSQELASTATESFLDKGIPGS